VEINDRDYFKEPFTRQEIKALLQSKSASEMFSFKSPSFKALGLDQAKLKDNDLINLMLKEPRLVRRPVVKIGKNVYFGADVKMLEKIVE